MNILMYGRMEACGRIMDELGDIIGLPPVPSSARYTAPMDTREWLQAVADLADREARARLWKELKAWLSQA